MHGFGPSILARLPREGAGATAFQVQDALRQACRAPSLSTIREHLRTLERMGLVYVERRGQVKHYWRLVDSVLDAAPLEAEA